MTGPAMLQIQHRVNANVVDCWLVEITPVTCCAIQLNGLLTKSLLGITVNSVSQVAPSHVQKVVHTAASSPVIKVTVHHVAKCCVCSVTVGSTSCIYSAVIGHHQMKTRNRRCKAVAISALKITSVDIVVVNLVIQVSALTQTHVAKR